MGQVYRNRLFLQPFSEGRGPCDLLGKSLFISNASALYEVYKTPESTMRHKGLAGLGQDGVQPREESIFAHHRGCLHLDMYPAFR